MLHVAPEYCFIKRFEKQLGDQHITADLESPLAKVKMDVLDIPFPDSSFDVIFCNHTLEHVEDDIRAMQELHRVLKPDGWGILQSPINYSREITYEDDTIIDPKERMKRFGQHDHLREYGKDYAQRLQKGGFKVEENDFVKTLSPEEQKRYALPVEEIIYVVRK
jgi:ubiquinone/menaquinone biosynthesis C-methylase UbiE